MNVERVSYRDPKWNIRFRILEIIICVLCLCVGILLNLKTDTKITIRLLVLIVGIFMTFITIFHLFGILLRKPPHFNIKWLFVATFGMAFFYLSAGALIIAQEFDISWPITFALTFTILAAIIFLLDIIYILRNLRRNLKSDEISPIVNKNQVRPVPYKCPSCEQPFHNIKYDNEIKHIVSCKDISIQINQPIYCDSKICLQKLDKVTSVSPCDIIYEKAMNESKETATIINVQPAPPQIYNCPKCFKRDCICKNLKQFPDPTPCPRCFKKKCQTCSMAQKIQEPPPQLPTHYSKYSSETFKICNIENIPRKKECTSQDILEELLVQQPPCNNLTSITEVKEESPPKLQLNNIFCPSCQRSCEETFIRKENLIRKSDIIFKKVNSVQFSHTSQVKYMEPLPKAPPENIHGVCPHCKQEMVEPQKYDSRNIPSASNSVQSLSSSSTSSYVKEDKKKKSKLQKRKKVSEQVIKKPIEKINSIGPKYKEDILETAVDVCPHCYINKLKPTEEERPIRPCQDISNISCNVCLECKKTKLNQLKDIKPCKYSQDILTSSSTICRMKDEKIEPLKEKTAPPVCPKCKKEKSEHYTAKNCQDTTDSASDVCQCKREKLEKPNEKPMTCDFKISNKPQEICSQQNILKSTKDNRVCRSCKKEVLEPPENSKKQDSLCLTSKVASNSKKEVICPVYNAKSTKHSQSCSSNNQQKFIECETCKKYWIKHQCPLCYQQCGKFLKDENEPSCHVCPICQQKCTNIRHETSEYKGDKTQFGKDKNNQAIICGESDCKIGNASHGEDKSNQAIICGASDCKIGNASHGEDKSNQVIICEASECNFMNKKRNPPEICENRNPLNETCHNPICSCIGKSPTFYSCVKCNETICGKPNKNRGISTQIIDERRYSGPLIEKDPFGPCLSDEKDDKCSYEDCHSQNRSEHIYISASITKRRENSSPSCSSVQSARCTDHEHTSRLNEYTYKHEQDKTLDDLTDRSKTSNCSLLSFKKFETCKAPAKKVEFRTPSTSLSSGSNKNARGGENFSDSQIISLKKLEDYTISQSETEIPHFDPSNLTSPKADTSSANLTVVYANSLESSSQSEVHDFSHRMLSKQTDESSQKPVLSKIKTLPCFSPKSDESNASENITISLQNRRKKSLEFFDNSTQVTKPKTPTITKSVISKTESSSISITPKSEDSISPPNSVTISELTFDSVTQSEKDYESQQSEKDNESLLKETQTDHVELKKFACEIIEIKTEQNYAEKFDVQERESNESHVEQNNNNREESQQLILSDERDENDIEQTNISNLPKDKEVAESTREYLKYDELTLSYKLSPSKIQSNNTIDSLIKGRVSLNDHTNSEKTNIINKNLDNFPVIALKKSISETIRLENLETPETNDDEKISNEKSSIELLQLESKPTDMTYPIHESQIFTSIDNFKGVPSKLRIPESTEKIIFDDDNHIYTLMDTPLEVINENEELSIYSRHEDVLRNEQQVREAIIQELMKMDEQYDKLQEGYEDIINSHETKLREIKSLTNSIDTSSKQSSQKLNKLNNTTDSSVDSKEIFSSILTDSDDNELKAKKDSLPDNQHFPPENTVDSNLEPLDLDYQNDKFETSTNEDFPDILLEKIQSASRHDINIESNVRSNHDNQNLKIKELINQNLEAYNLQKQNDEQLLSENSANQSELTENNNTLSEQLQISECIAYNTMKLDELIQQNKEYLESIGLEFSDIEDKTTDHESYKKSDQLEIQKNFYSSKSEKSIKQDKQYAESVKTENSQLRYYQNQDSGQSESEESKNEDLQPSEYDLFKTEDIQHSKLAEYSKEEIAKPEEFIIKEKSEFTDESSKENSAEELKSKLIFESNRASSSSSNTKEILAKKDVNYVPESVTDDSIQLELVNNDKTIFIRKTNSSTLNLKDSDISSISPYTSVYKQSYQPKDIQAVPTTIRQKFNTRTAKSENDADTDNDIKSFPKDVEYELPLVKQDVCSAPCTSRKIAAPSKTSRSENDSQELIPNIVKSKYIKLSEKSNEIHVLKGVLNNDLPLESNTNHDTTVQKPKISHIPKSTRPISTRTIPLLTKKEKTSSHKNILLAEDEYSLCESNNTEQSLKIYATINKIVEQSENEIFIRYKVPNSEQYYYDANNKVLKEENIDIYDFGLGMENNPTVPPLSIPSLSPELSDTDAQNSCYASQQVSPRKNLQFSYPCSPKKIVCGEGARIFHEHNKHSSEKYMQKPYYKSACSTPGIKYAPTPGNCPNIEHEQLCYSCQFENAPVICACPKSPRQECLSYKNPSTTKCGTARKTRSTEPHCSNIHPIKNLVPCTTTTPRPTLTESRFISKKTPIETKKPTPKLEPQEAEVEYHSDSEANRKKSSINYKTHSTIPKYTSLPTAFRNSQQNKRNKSPMPRRRSSP